MRTATVMATPEVSRNFTSGLPTLPAAANVWRSSKLAPQTRLTRESIWFGGQPLAQIATTTGAIHWYFNDHLGTPILQTDSEANLVWRVEYDPYGSVHQYRTGAEKHQPLRFPGQENDERSDISYNVFRHYRASWGRYTQADPVGLGDISPYAYSAGNPLRYSDPFGLFNVDNRIKKQPSANPSVSCGSPFACSQVLATVYCDCHCDPTIGRVVADATLLLLGTIYYYSGPFNSIKQRPVDPTVTNAATAIAHEYNYHINPATNAVSSLLAELESKGFNSEQECRSECSNVAKQVNDAFNQTLRATQEQENQK